MMTAPLFKNKYRIPSARLSGWNYSNSGGYFVTICTKEREHYFGSIAKGVMALNAIGRIAQDYWCRIPELIPSATLGEFIIMPNHMHSIVFLDKREDLSIGKKEIVSNAINKRMATIAPKARSLSAIIRSYKAAVTRWANEHQQEFAWQSRFHDHIIRDDEELIAISNYIINNPRNWKEDKFFIP